MGPRGGVLHFGATVEEKEDKTMGRASRGGGGKGKGGKRGAQHPLTKMPPFFPPLSLCLFFSLACPAARSNPTNFGEIFTKSLREKSSERAFSERGGRRCYRRRRRTLLDIHHHLRDNAVMMTTTMIIALVLIIIAGFFDR